MIYLNERECSIQRRHQKVIEEAPSPFISEATRKAMGEQAVQLAKAVKYQSAGTVEFVVGKDQSFYFLEMNARIQVEHPVTEAICGLDLVAEQIAVAEGHPLGLQQDEIRFTGHAIECRINAEDWSRDFAPCPGVVQAATFPSGSVVRVDTHIQAGVSVSPYYDSLLAKLIVHGQDRNNALDRLRQALARCEISGVTTNLPIHVALMNQEEFVRGGVTTAYFPWFLEQHAAVACQ